MHKVLKGLIDKGVIVYIDDILIYSDNEREHLALVRQVLSRLKEHGLAVDIEKCSFSVPIVEFLGYIMGQEGMKIDNSKVKVIVD